MVHLIFYLVVKESKLLYLYGYKGKMDLQIQSVKKEYCPLALDCDVPAVFDDPLMFVIASVKLLLEASEQLNHGVVLVHLGLPVLVGLCCWLIMAVSP